MSSCCDANACPTATDRGEVCPRCGTKGKAVDLSTVKALLTETALARIEPGAYRFCLASTCDTVYFDGSGRIFTRGDLRVPVWQKERGGNRMVCYCFGENEADIRAEVVSHGRSHAVDRVTAHVRAGRCACELRNPVGRCCLGDVAAAVKRMAASIQPCVGA